MWTSLHASDKLTWIWESTGKTLYPGYANWCPGQPIIWVNNVDFIMVRPNIVGTITLVQIRQLPMVAYVNCNRDPAVLNSQSLNITTFKKENISIKTFLKKNLCSLLYDTKKIHRSSRQSPVSVTLTYLALCWDALEDGMCRSMLPLVPGLCHRHTFYAALDPL